MRCPFTAAVQPLQTTRQRERANTHMGRQTDRRSVRHTNAQPTACTDAAEAGAGAVVLHRNVYNSTLAFGKSAQQGGCSWATIDGAAAAAWSQHDRRRRLHYDWHRRRYQHRRYWRHWHWQRHRHGYKHRHWLFHFFLAPPLHLSPPTTDCVRASGVPIVGRSVLTRPTQAAVYRYY